MDEKIYRINEEVVEGSKKTLRRENNKNCRGGTSSELIYATDKVN